MVFLLDSELRFLYIFPTQIEFLSFTGADALYPRVIPAGDPWLNPATV
jgi:hypothetical protein